MAAAARLIRAGEADLVVAGGVESMSRAPFVMGKADAPFARDARLYDTTIGWRFVNPRMQELFGTDAMGETAENVAEEWKIERTDQDAFALRSQLRARAAQRSGRLAQEIVPVTGAPGQGDRPGRPRTSTRGTRRSRRSPGSSRPSGRAAP